MENIRMESALNGENHPTPASNGSGTVKISANLPREDFETLKHLAGQRRVTMTVVLRDAIDTEKYFADVIANGGKVLIEDKNGVVHRVLFK
jgi:hypothetical protein